MLDVQCGNTTALLHQHLAFDLDIESRSLAFEPVGFEHHVDAGLGDLEDIVIEKHVQHLHIVKAERAQQDTGRQLAATVDAHKQRILGVEFEIEPGSAVGNHARRKQQFTRGMRFAAVVVKKHPVSGAAGIR